MNPNKANQRSKKKSNGKATLVLASTKAYTRHNIPSYEVAGYKCSCGHSGAVQAALQNPHCSKCGSEVATVKKEANTTVARIENEDSTVSLQCASCDVHNIMSTTAAIAFDGSVHCANCGEHLEYDASEVASDFEDDVDLDNGTGSDDVTDTIHESSFEDDDVEIEDDVEEADFDDEAEDTADEDIDDLEGEEDASEADDYLGGDTADDPDTDEGETEEDIEDESVLSRVKVEPTPIVASLGKKATSNLRVVAELDNGKIHIFAKDHCVATLDETENNRSVFGNEKHLNLIHASLDEQGFDATVESFGFTTAKLRVTNAKALEPTLAKMSKQQAFKLSSKLKAQASVMRESLEIAAVGFNRDVFAATHSNPLKDGVLNLLASLGVDKVTAALQVQNVFAKAGDEYVEVLLEKAHEIAGYDAKLRGQLAATYASMSAPVPNLQAVASDDHDLDDDVDEADDYLADDTELSTTVAKTVEHRLDRPLRRVTEQASAKQGSGKSSLFSRSSLSFNP